MEKITRFVLLEKKILLGVFVVTVSIPILFFFFPSLAHAESCPAGQVLVTPWVDPTAPPAAPVCVPISDAGGSYVGGANLANATAPIPDPPTDSCSLFNPTKWFTQCVWFPFTKLLGQSFLAFGGAVLSIAGGLFDLLLQHVILDFAGTLNAMHLTTWIEKVWTLFRDFSNIAIIGLFIFIAISIILELQPFGQKRLIANALIVAILINFSLLFARLIIDFSNFTAYQFYSAMAGTTNPDIAQAFLNGMHITSIWNDSGVLIQAVQNTTDSGWPTLLYGLVGGIMLIGVSVVLLYAAFLMAARGILFIFLMITAALAFMTYVIPQLSEGQFGLKNWWKTLINSAVFAPLFMLFLVASLAVVMSAGKGLDSVLGKVAASPATLTAAGGAAAGAGSDSIWASILLYLTGTGLLFLSVRLSSKFASSISGFNYAQIATAAPVSVGARLIAAPLRQTVGRGAYGSAEALQRGGQQALARAAAERNNAANLRANGNVEGAAAADRTANRLQRIAERRFNNAGRLRSVSQSNFNLADSGLAKTLNRAAGNTGALSGASNAQGYAGQVQAAAKRAVQHAEGRQVDDAGKAELMKQARQQAEKMHIDAIQRSRDAEKALAEKREEIRLASSPIEAQQKLAAENLNIIRGQKADRESQYNQAKGDLIRRLGQATTDAEQMQIRTQLGDLDRTYEYESKEIDAALTQKEAEVKEIESRIEEVKKPLAQAETVYQNAHQAAETTENIDAQAQKFYEINYRQATNMANDATEHGVEHASGSIANRAALRRGDVADAARTMVRKSRTSEAQIAKMLRDIQDKDTGGGAAPSASVH